MDTAAFLAKILPESGLYVIAHSGVDKRIRHVVCQSIGEAAMQVLHWSNNGHETWHACAAYREAAVPAKGKDGSEYTQVRVHRNVRAIKSFWCDLDVGAGDDKKYESQAAALEGLLEFCQETKLPLPTIVSSGYGIHLYWTLTHEIIPEQWRPAAEQLKALCAAAGLKADPACTSDPARILRSVGTANRKVPASPRWVELVATGEDTSFDRFQQTVESNLKVRGVAVAVRAVKDTVGRTEHINAEFEIKRDFPPCSAIKVADRCAQLRIVRDTRGNIPEPHWYAAIQLLNHAVEGPALIHEWSMGYKGYTAAETDRKIAQVRNMGPTTCTTFESRNPGGCKGCPFAGKITSPAQLGAHVASAPAPVVDVEINAVITKVTLPEPPAGFTRGLTGGIYYEDADGITHKIYGYDFYPVEIAYDEQLGYETTRWRHCLPKDGWKEFTLRSSLIARPLEFESALRDNHVKPLIRNKMAMYGDAYIRKLSEDAKMRQLFKAQGWKNDTTEFVLGDKLFKKGEVIDAGISNGAEGFLRPFTSRGSLETWRTLTQALSYNPDFAPHAFMLLIAFAAPLLELAGRQGFTVCALGLSGAGKSTMARWMSSVYGTQDGSWIGRTDSIGARYERMGAHRNVPVYMDELTTIKAEVLRDLIYEVPLGKSRHTLRQDRTLREGPEWSTIFVTSSNDSLQAKLQLEKANAEAESMRLFEFAFPRVADFGPISKMVPAIISENYGVAGARYIQQLVNNRLEVKLRLATVVEEAERDFGMDDKERFWSQAIALTLYGGELARQWGIIDFDPQFIRPWLLAETQRMRSTVNENIVSSTAILSRYLNEHIGERLTVSALNSAAAVPWTKPMHKISQRYEKDTGLLYVAASHVKEELTRRHVNVNILREELTASGVLVAANTRRTLGAGTDFTGGSVPCWCIKVDHPELIDAGVRV